MSNENFLSIHSEYGKLGGAYNKPYHTYQEACSEDLGNMPFGMLITVIYSGMQDHSSTVLFTNSH